MSLPNHIAIIPDGNRRWAKTQRLNAWEGHTEGVKRFWDSSEYLHDSGINHVTYWAASYSNLKKRSKIEVRFLMKLLEEEIFKPEILERCLRNKVRVHVIGEWREFIKSKKLIDSIEKIERETAKFAKKTLNFLFAYDGQREMLAAANAFAKSGAQATEKSLRTELWTGVLPDVDLVIRTGGEPHWSAGFMMWLTANTEFYFTETLWPAFKNAEIKKAIDLFDRRERRLGK